MKILIKLACLIALNTPISLVAQATQTTQSERQAPVSDLELFYSTTSRADGLFQIDIVVAGLNGVEIDQLDSDNSSNVLSHTILAPAKASQASYPTNLFKTALVLEKQPGKAGLPIFVHEFGNTKRGINIVMPTEIQEKNAHISVHFPSSIRSGGGSPNPNMYPIGGGDCPEGTYPISYTSSRCGTITACCSSPGASIDGVSCSIKCN